MLAVLIIVAPESYSQTGTARGSVYGYSLWKFEVYSKLCDNQINGSGQICHGGSTVFKINVAGTTYQWQLNTGSGFTDISDNNNYTGTNTSNLHLNNLPSSWYGYAYRCIVDGVSSNTVPLSFSDTWIGSTTTRGKMRLTGANGALPDSNTDVIINNGSVSLNSNAAIRSIHLNTGVNFTVNPKFKFTITH